MPSDSAASLLYEAWKRGFDFLVAGGLLILFSPLLLLLSALIRLDSPGHVLFRQIRVGKEGKSFSFYKFRSMIWDAEARKKDLLDLNEAEAPLFKIEADPRITRLGRILRNTSLDELPQLINVLKGDLSLVGPRPHLPEEVAGYSEAQMVRLSVTPGITCQWQASNRSSTRFDAWIESDLDYIMNRSIGLDLRILCQTVVTVFSRRNAS